MLCGVTSVILRDFLILCPPHVWILNTFYSLPCVITVTCHVSGHVIGVSVLDMDKDKDKDKDKGKDKEGACPVLFYRLEDIRKGKA